MATAPPQMLMSLISRRDVVLTGLPYYPELKENALRDGCIDTANSNPALVGVRAGSSVVDTNKSTAP